MRSSFRQIPEALQRQILYRLGCGAALMIVIIVFSFAAMDLSSILSCVAVMIFFIFSSFSLFRRAVAGDYVVVRGECLNATLTAVRRRTKMITIHTEDGKRLQITVKQHLKKICAGSQITLYAAANMPVYEKGDVLVMYSYIAMEVKAG